jgi:hypothetical protein
MQLNRGSVRGFLVTTKLEMEWQQTMSLLIISIALAPFKTRNFSDSTMISSEKYIEVSSTQFF